MASASAGVAYLERRIAGVIDGATVDWGRYLNPEDKSRIIPAEALAEQVKREILLGREAELGLGLPWPKTADKVLLRPGKLSIWTGWSRHGKTQMLKQLMLHGIGNGERVLICSMEEEVREVWRDMAWIACGRDDASPRQIDRFVDFVRGKLYLFDQQGQINAKKAVALVRYAAAELKVTHVVVDSLMMMALGRDDYDGQARFVGELKTAAKDGQCHVHLVAHMRKRDGKTGEEAPGTLHDIAGGHELGSITDNAFVVWRDRERKDPSKPDVILKVEKQRGRVNWTGTIGLNTHVVSRQFVESIYAMKFWGREPGEDD